MGGAKRLCMKLSRGDLIGELIGDLRGERMDDLILTSTGTRYGSGVLYYYLNYCRARASPLSPVKHLLSILSNEFSYEQGDGVISLGPCNLGSFENPITGAGFSLLRTDFPMKLFTLPNALFSSCSKPGIFSLYAADF
jgi:hypothetical protein